jgi:hypothetical protein
VETVYSGERLTPEEQILNEGVPAVASKLLDHVPRLEPIVQILASLNYSTEQLEQLGAGPLVVRRGFCGSLQTSIHLRPRGIPPIQRCRCCAAVKTDMAASSCRSLPLTWERAPARCRSLKCP